MWVLKNGSGYTAVALKDSNEEKFSYWAERWVMHLFIHFV